MYDNKWFNPKDISSYHRTYLLQYDTQNRIFTVRKGKKGLGALVLLKQVPDREQKDYAQEIKIMEWLKEKYNSEKTYLMISANICPVLRDKIEMRENPNICVCYNPEEHTIKVYQGKNTKGKLLLDFNIFNRKSDYLVEEKAKLKGIKEYALENGYKLFLTGSTSLLIQQIQKQDEEKIRSCAKKDSHLRKSDQESAILATYLL